VTIQLCLGSITHFNLPVPEGQTRSSFTQWMAGGLAQHIAYGFRSEVELGHEELKKFAAEAASRWEDSLRLFLTPATLHDDRKPLLDLF
jgi:hypothetical protein